MATTTETNSVINFLRSNPNSTKSAIAKAAFGLNKCNERIEKIINDVLAEGKITEDTTARYVTYSVAQQASAATNQAIPTAAALPEQELKNYKVKATIKENQIVGYTITNNAGNKFDIKAQDVLVVINDKPLYVVSDAPGVLGAIQDYTKKNNIVTFSITDAYTGKIISTTEDFQLTNKVLFFNVSKVNKAA